MNEAGVHRTIVLIDDSPTEIMLFQEVYAELAYPHTLIALHTAEDVSHFLSPKGLPVVGVPDCIILDLSMPGISGLDILRAIRGRDDMAAVPVIVFSASDSSDNILAAYRHHANCFISKPDGLIGMYTVVKKIMVFWFETVRLPPVSQQ